GQNLTDVLDDLTASLKLKERPFPIHRLDKPTTGALILARTPQFARSLSQQIKSHTLQKTYLALVRRAFSPGTSGEVRQRLYITDGRVCTDMIEPSMYRNAPTEARETLTTWKCVRTSGEISLLELGLCTGVKHQLRVVCASVLG
ncbi:hypothetical protein FRC09_018172, partial [Ceratobasidium sp. 395]